MRLGWVSAAQHHGMIWLENVHLSHVDLADTQTLSFNYGCFNKYRACDLADLADLTDQLSRFHGNGQAQLPAAGHNPPFTPRARITGSH